MFGAFTGAAIGLVLDALEAGRAKATETGARLKVRAHDAAGTLGEATHRAADTLGEATHRAADTLGEATHRAGDWVKDQDVPGRLRSTIEDVASSAPVERVRHAVD
jgi:hypothetical protein